MRQFEKNAFRKNIKKQKEEIVWTEKYCIDNFFNTIIKCEIIAKLNIYHLFATALVLIRSPSRKVEKKKRRGQRVWIWPLFADRATSGAFTN